MEYKIEKTCKSVSAEKLQDDVEKLQEDIRRLENQMVALQNIGTGKTTSVAVECEPPYPATEKLQRCKSCKYMRMPHKSNAHYTCNVRHSTIEPTWTCELYYDKNNQGIPEAVTTCGH